MRRSTAVIGSAAYFAAAAGTFAVLVPWLVTGWEFHRPWSFWVVAQGAGVLLIGAGTVPVVSVFVQFARAGGTPLPLAPTRRLVVSGFNRYVRNPVYLGSLLIFAGEALLFGSLRLLAYTVSRVGGGGGVRAVLRGTCPDASVRGRVRGVPAGGARLAAPAAPLDGG